jgi:hypothetical protein
VFEAAKHALVSGNQIDAVSITHNYAGEPPAPAPVLIDRLDGYEPPPSGGTMSKEELEGTIASDLPEWARTMGELTVIEDYAGERVVSLTLRLPIGMLRVVDVSSFLILLQDHQDELASEGARIGRVTVEVTDQNSGEPLYAGAADSPLGLSVQWESPLLLPFSGPGRLSGEATNGIKPLNDTKDEIDDALVDAPQEIHDTKAPLDQAYEQAASDLDHTVKESKRGLPVP